MRGLWTSCWWWSSCSGGASEDGAGSEPCGWATRGETIWREGSDIGTRGAVTEVERGRDGNDGGWEGGCELDVGSEAGGEDPPKEGRGILGGARCSKGEGGGERCLSHGGKWGQG